MSLGVFSNFLKILIFWAKNGVKEQKWPKCLFPNMFVVFSIFSTFEAFFREKILILGQKWNKRAKTGQE